MLTKVDKQLGKGIGKPQKEPQSAFFQSTSFGKMMHKSDDKKEHKIEVEVLDPGKRSVMVKKKTFVDKNGLQLVELPSQGDKFSPARSKNN